MNEMTRAATATCAEHVFVGMSPGGIEWNAYVREGEPVEAFRGRVGALRSRLLDPRERTDLVIVKVPKLTGNGVYYIEDTASLFEDELAADAEAMETGKTYVKATRRLLEDVADQLEIRVEDYADCAYASVNSDHAERAEFAERAVRRSIHTVVARVRDACAGRAPRRKIR